MITTKRPIAVKPSGVEVSILFVVLILGSVLLSVPVVVFVIEIFAFVFIAQKSESSDVNKRARVAVLVPAHNESSGILATLRDVQRQLDSSDRLVVIADNCLDDTAAIAVEFGSEVIERDDLKRIGKGFALDYGLQYLAKEPPGIVIVIDADCRVSAGTIDRLARECSNSQRPVQSLDLMVSSEHSPIDHHVAEFAWRIKNQIRPLGLRALNLPCQLMGTGMAFPWEVIRSANLASGQIVEDLKLGIDLAELGKPPLFCPSACVTSTFPSTVEGTKSQRERWERGQLGLIMQLAPKLLPKAIAYRNVNLLALILDLLVPPLTVLAMLLAANFLLNAIALLLGTSTVPLIFSVCLCFLFAAAVGLAWTKVGRDLLPRSRLLTVVIYFFGKLNLYTRIFSKRKSLPWERADRAKD